MFSVVIVPIQPQVPAHHSSYSTYMSAILFGETVIGAADVAAIFVFEDKKCIRFITNSDKLH